MVVSRCAVSSEYLFDRNHHGEAIIHYQPDPNNCATIRKDQVQFYTNIDLITAKHQIDIPLRLWRYAMLRTCANN